MASVFLPPRVQITIVCLSCLHRSCVSVLCDLSHTKWVIVSVPSKGLSFFWKKDGILCQLMPTWSGLPTPGVLGTSHSQRTILSLRYAIFLSDPFHHLPGNTLAGKFYLCKVTYTLYICKHFTVLPCKIAPAKSRTSLHVMFVKVHLCETCHFERETKK